MTRRPIETLHPQVAQGDLFASRSALHPNVRNFYRVVHRTRQRVVLHKLVTTDDGCAPHPKLLTDWTEQTDIRCCLKTDRRGQPVLFISRAEVARRMP